MAVVALKRLWRHWSPLRSVQVSLTDTPIEDADNVVVSVSGVAFKPEGSAPEVVESFTARSIDLLQYQNGRTAILLQDTPMKAGRYQWLRLIIDTQPVVRDSYIVIDGNECELNVPSGAETGSSGLIDGRRKPGADRRLRPA
jgi:hypothetical protein